MSRTRAAFTRRSKTNRSTAPHPLILGGMVALLAPQAFSQLPPGARVIQIEMADRQFSPSINDSRQVVFSGWTGRTNRDIYLYEDGEVTQLTSGPLVNLLAVINNQGHIAWVRGVWDGNRDVFFDDGEDVRQITDTPQPEGQLAINDSDQLAWTRLLCYPDGRCRDIFLLPSLDAEAIQLTDGRGILFNAVPVLSETGLAAWWQSDDQFGFFNSPDKIMLYDGREITALTDDENGYTPPHFSPDGRIMWTQMHANPSGPIFEWADGTTREILRYGAVNATNDRADVFLVTGEDSGMSWLMRNGAFYQVFNGRTSISVEETNARGDCVGTGSGFAGEPADIFLSFIDPIPGDHDEDGDLDLDDLSGLSHCLTGPGEGLRDETCMRVDFDDNGQVDLRDVGAFQIDFTGDCALGITTPPGGEGVCIGDEVRMDIDVRGRVASYQWTFEREPIAGATEQTYVIPSARLSDEAEYGVIVTSECGWESRSDKRHRLKVHTIEPVFDEQPVSQEACRGQDVRFCALLAFVEDGPYDFVDFKWQKDGVDIEGVSDWFCLMLRDVDESDVGQYRCIATNACGTTVSRTATLTLAPDDAPPRILRQPESVRVDPGHPASFNVLAACADSYQWKKDGQDMPGETRSDLFIFPVTCDDAGEYTVTAINTHGEVTSDPARLTVNNCP